MKINLIIVIVILKVIESQKNIEEIKNQLTENCSNPTHKHYPLITLGYITPWKRKGYEMVEKYYNKFNIISPTWFELKGDNYGGEFNIRIDGGNNVDMSYLKDIRLKNPNLKIIPRLHCEQLSIDDYKTWFSGKSLDNFIKILIRRADYNNLDGFIFDCIHFWINEEVFNSFSKALPLISKALHDKNKNIIITLFPYTENKIINEVNDKNIEYLSNYVDYFNIMTYDYLQYSNEENNNLFNAPLNWIKKTINYYVPNNNTNILQKILLGLPFHGYLIEKNDKRKGSILDSDKYEMFVNTIDEGLKWDEIACEHTIIGKENNKDIVAIYPTRDFFKERLKYSLDKKLGGIAIWDIGNGIENFMNEF